MRFFYKLGVLALAFALSYTAQAETVYGKCDFGKVKLKDLTCYGMAELKNTKVTGKLNVYGKLSADHATLNTVNVKGSMEVDKSVITGDVKVYGFFDSEGSSFSGNIKAYTYKMNLESTKVDGDITIEAEIKQPTLVLKDKTKVKGGVIFSRKAGVVEQSKESNVVGKIKNGSTRLYENEDD